MRTICLLAAAIGFVFDRSSRVVCFTVVAPLSARLRENPAPAPYNRLRTSLHPGQPSPRLPSSVQLPPWGAQRREKHVLDGVEQGVGEGDRVGGSAKAEETGPKSRAAQESEMFDWLADGSNVCKKVSLDFVQKGGGRRGLVVNDSVKQGEVLLEVPSQVCLWSTRDGVVSGLQGQTDMCWEAAGDLREPASDEDYARGLTWDVRLAVALMEATTDMQIGGKFWSYYGRLLPPPHTVTVPFCLPERLLTQLHNEGMAARARKQIDRLRNLFPIMMQTLLSHPLTARYTKKQGVTAAATTPGQAEESDAAPMALAWAFAMVRSRAFAADNDLFAFVPFLDMANHDFAPSTNFTYEDPGVFRLRALRDMVDGEEATISYGQQLDAEQLMVQYGFPAPPNANLARPLMDPSTLRNRTITSTANSVPATGTEQDVEEYDGKDDWEEVQRRALMDDLFRRAQYQFAQKAGGREGDFEIKVRRAVPLIPAMATTIQQLTGDADDLEEGARVYLSELQAYRAQNFATTEDQDRELLRWAVETAGPPPSVRLRAACGLRPSTVV